MVDFLCMNVEVSGCPTACMHCWARGSRYSAMPLGDLSAVLEHATRFFSDNGRSLYAYPLHEVLAHPQASEVMAQFRKSCGISFEPLPTTGVPLATMDNWRQVLEDMKALGISTVWFTFHGIGEAHDRQVNRPGAFDETCTAVSRVHSMGFKSRAKDLPPPRVDAQPLAGPGTCRTSKVLKRPPASSRERT